MDSKIKISQKDFDELYTIEEKVITGETDKASSKQDTTPSIDFLTQEEEDFDTQMHDDSPEEKEILE